MDTGPVEQPRDPFAPPDGSATTPGPMPPPAPVEPPPWQAAAPAYGAVVPPGWYPDPYGTAQQRYWDGTTWGQASGEPPAKPGTDGVAIAALVLSIFSLLLPAVICSVVALNRISKSRQAGRGLAIASLVISGVWLVGIVVYAVNAVNADPSSSGSVSGSKLTGAQLLVGQCVEVPDPVPATGQVFERRECTAGHNGEVMTADNMPDGDYPGLDQVKSTVLTDCRNELRAYSGSDTSSLHVVYLYPTSDSWAAGDRRFVCVAVDRAGDVTATMRGSRL